MLCIPTIIWEKFDNSEDGGHVRDGYTLESYRKLLEPAGFRIEKSFGIGSSY